MIDNLHGKVMSIAVAAMFMTVGLAGIAMFSDDSDAYDLTFNKTVFIGEPTTVDVSRYYGYGSSYVWPGTVNVTSNVPGLTLKYDSMKLSGTSPSGSYVSQVDHLMDFRLEGTPTSYGTHTFRMTCTEMSGESGWATATWTVNVTVVDPIVVSFDSQGGSENPASQTTTSLRLPSPGEKADHEFLGWYDAPVGGNLIGQYNKAYSPTASITLYAQWKALKSNFYAIMDFDANGGTGAPSQVSDHIYAAEATGSASLIVPSQVPTRQYYDFKGWAEVSDAVMGQYQPGDTVSVDYGGSKTLFAVWEMGKPEITSTPSTTVGIVGDSWSYDVTTDRSAAISVNGASWLTVNGNTIVGTPSVSGTYNVSVTATYGSHSDVQEFQLVIVDRLSFESVPTGSILVSPA